MITSIKYYITILIASILFVSCSDDISYPGVDSNDNDSQNSLIIQIQREGGAQFTSSRADQDASEIDINDIYAVLVPQSGDIIVKPLYIVSSGGNTYTLKDVYQGSYRIYILANIDDYLEPEESTTKLTDKTFNSESDIKNLQLYFHADDPIEPGEIPMGATPGSDITASYSDSRNHTSDQYISLSNSYTTTVTAKLSFLCSKVRYTILFDASPNGHSSNFGDKRIEFVGTDISTPYAQNILSSIPLTGTGNYGSPIEGVWNMYLQRYNYPAEGQKYPQKPSSSLGSPVSEWKNDAQRAWQGVIYLPENLSNNKTTLNFYYEIDGMPCNTPKTIPLFDGNTTSTGLTRGKMYDVVALVKDPNVFDITVTTSKKYRFYWYRYLINDRTGVYDVNAPGIALTLTDGTEILKKTGTPIGNNHYYVDFEYDGAGEINYEFFNNAGSSIIKYTKKGTLNDFELMGSYYCGYINSEGENITKGKPDLFNKFNLAWHYKIGDDVYNYVYLTSDNYEPTGSMPGVKTNDPNMNNEVNISLSPSKTTYYYDIILSGGNNTPQIKYRAYFDEVFFVSSDKEYDIDIKNPSISFDSNIVIKFFKN